MQRSKSGDGGRLVGVKIKPVLAGSSPSDSLAGDDNYPVARELLRLNMHTSTTWPWHMHAGLFPVQVQSSPEFTVHILQVPCCCMQRGHAHYVQTRT